MPIVSADASDARRLFISYRRDDTGSEAARLAERLGAEFGAENVFWDRDAIEGGQAWRERLQAEAANCQACLVLIGKGWLKAQDGRSGRRRLDMRDDWVRKEIELGLHARAERGLAMIPLLVSGSSMPEEGDLPESIAALAGVSGMPLRPAPSSDWDGDIARLLGRLRSLGVGTAPLSWLTDYVAWIVERHAQHLREVLPDAPGGSIAPLPLVVVERRAGAQAGVAQARGAGATATASIDEVLGGSGPLRVLLFCEGGGGKTTSLLQAAARTAQRALTDPGAPMPVLVSLVGLARGPDGQIDLRRYIDLGLPQVSSASTLTLEMLARRPLLFLIDAFNELRPDLHSEAAKALGAFAGGFAQRHSLVIASRPSPHLEAIATGAGAGMRMFDIQRLDADQVREHLAALGLGALHESMPEELKELAANPFMLMAITRTLSHTPRAELPRNRGALYRQFVQGWMQREMEKREPRYSFERVKHPMLSRLAALMTAAGVTAIVRQDDVDAFLEEALAAIHTRVQRLGGMQADWTVDDVLREVAAEGLFRQSGDRWGFLHQSVQDYFTACHFKTVDPDALVAFTPGGVGDTLAAKETELPNQRFVQSLLLMAGLLDDASSLVERLVQRHPLLAAAAVGAASRVAPKLLAQLEQRWLGAIAAVAPSAGDEDEDEDDRLAEAQVACACLKLARRDGPQVLRALVGALDGPLEETATETLGELTRSELARRTVAAALAGREGEGPADALDWATTYLMRQWPHEALLASLVELWRDVTPGTNRELRLAAMFAHVAVENGETVASVLEYLKRKRPADAPAADGLAMALGRREELEASRRGEEEARDAALGGLAAARTPPQTVTEIVQALLVAEEQRWREQLVESLGRLAPAAREQALRDLADAVDGEPRVIARLDPALADALDAGDDAPLLRALSGHLPYFAGARLTVRVDEGSADRMTRWYVWNKLLAWWDTPPGRAWHIEARGTLLDRHHILRRHAGALELCDPFVAVHALLALDLAHPDAERLLYGRLDDARPEIHATALALLSERGAPGLAEQLLDLLSKPVAPTLASAVLKSLRRLRPPAALSLFDELYLDVREDDRTVHPRWGIAPERDDDWPQAIAELLFALDDRQAVLQRCASAVRDPAGRSLLPALAALCEGLSRSPGLETERPMLQQLLPLDELMQMALHHPEDAVRARATELLAAIDDSGAFERAVEVLAGQDLPSRLAAAAVLVGLNEEEHHARIAQAMIEIVSGDAETGLRQRAGEVLARLNDGSAPLFTRWDELANRHGHEAALAFVEHVLLAMPEDVDLRWARAHSLSALGGRVDEAIAEFEFAFAQVGSPLVGRALVTELHRAGRIQRALEVAAEVCEGEPDNAEASALMTHACAAAGDWARAAESAVRALRRDPVLADVAWTAVLAALHRGDVAAATAAHAHADLLWRHLRDGLDDLVPADLRDKLESLPALEAPLAVLRDASVRALTPARRAGTSEAAA